MSDAQDDPRARIAYIDSVVRDCLDVAESWEVRHRGLVELCWPWEDLIARMNDQYGRLMGMRSGMRRLMSPSGSNLEREISDLVADIDRSFSFWAVSAEEFLDKSHQFEATFGTIQGLGELRKNLDRTREILVGHEDTRPVPLHSFYSGFVRSAVDLGACNKVSLAGGLGMVLALAVGSPIWIGFLVGFLPAFVAGGIAHTSHG